MSPGFYKKRRGEEEEKEGIWLLQTAKRLEGSVKAGLSKKQDVYYLVVVPKEET